MTNVFWWIDSLGREWNLNEGPVTIQAGAEGFEDPETEQFVRASPLLDGQVYEGWRGVARELFIPVQIQPGDVPGGFANADFEVVRQEFLRGLRPGSYGTFRVDSSIPGIGSRYIRVRYLPNPTSLDIDPHVLGWQKRGLAFVADNTWWTGVLIQQQFQTAETPLPFYAVTTDRVLNIMSANTIDNHSLYNPGEFRAWPIFRLDGDVTSFKISQFPGGVEITGAINVPLGEHLIIDTTPTVQTAMLSNGGGLFYTDVTDQLDNALFFSIPAGNSQPIYIEINGGGSAIASLTPQYMRAF